jgi:hypothetical protein
MTTSRERLLVQLQQDAHAVAISGDGTRFMYSLAEGNQTTYHWRDVDRMHAYVLCESCTPLAMSRKGDRVLEQRGADAWVHDLTSGEAKLALTGIQTGLRGRQLDYAHELRFLEIDWSRDEKWLAFQAGEPQRVFVAPVRPGNPTYPAEWMEIAPGSYPR